MAKRLTLEKRIILETLLKLPFSSFMDNLSIAKKTTQDSQITGNQSVHNFKF